VRLQDNQSFIKKVEAEKKRETVEEEAMAGLLTHFIDRGQRETAGWTVLLVIK